MRAFWIGSMGVIIGLTGCTTTQPNLKNPTPPHEYKLPDDDPRWTREMQYPEKVLNNPIRREPTIMPASSGTRGGGGPGMMGGGGGGMGPSGAGGR